jgi:hypothetical protein
MLDRSLSPLLVGFGREFARMCKREFVAPDREGTARRSGALSAAYACCGLASQESDTQVSWSAFGQKRTV